MTVPESPDKSWMWRAPASLLESGLCAQGDPDRTPLDRRWLWRLESFLAVYGTTNGQRQMGCDLRQYLNETCEHHWHEWAGDDQIPAHRQCSWCAGVEWLEIQHPDCPYLAGTGKCVSGCTTEPRCVTGGVA